MAAPPTMDGSISAFCGAMSAFLSHLESTSDALTESLRRRPIPLDSAAAAFVERLGQRVAAAGTDLELLEDMAMGTVSLAELLGHCGELYRRNQVYVDLLHDRLSAFGYIPEIDSDDGESEDFGADSKLLSPENGLVQSTQNCGPPLGGGSSRRRLLDEDPLFDGSLQNMGLSDACLATLASEAKDCPESPKMQPEDLVCLNKGEICENKMLYHSSLENFDSEGVPRDNIMLGKCSSGARAIVEISKEDYDKLPAYVKSLASWEKHGKDMLLLQNIYAAIAPKYVTVAIEDLQEAVTKMNSGLCKQDTSKDGSLSQDDLEALGLGRKGKSYILALIRMNRLAVDTLGGSVVYRVVNDRNV